MEAVQKIRQNLIINTKAAALGIRKRRLLGAAANSSCTCAPLWRQPAARTLLTGSTKQTVVIAAYSNE
ncbi:hypothetical protein ACFO4L_04980 [Bacillus daqingensis]|uniref:Uncharacterized protein n=1 Tax=Bacillus daqingensis TaxID=872396 RepID=A0ABV9NU18_9BACI